MYVDEQTYLAHYGVKGMKWGVRKKDNLAVRGVQRIGRTMATGPFGKAGIKAGKKINEANAKRSKRVVEARTNLSNIKKSAKEVRAIKKSRKAQAKAEKEKQAAIRQEANKKTSEYITKVLEPKLAKKYGKFENLSDFERMEKAFFDKTMSELKKRG